MIRIDEIYQNVFLPIAAARDKIGLHWFDPFGSTRIEDICSLPAVDIIAKQRIIFWDQEPVSLERTDLFLSEFQKNYFGPLTLVTSEKNSESVKNLSEKHGLKTSYYFFHAWAALDWYRGYNHSFLCKKFVDREIQHNFLCLNNIIGGERKHRIYLLKELIDHGLIENNLISFPKICPFENLSIYDLIEKYQIDLSLGNIKLPLIVDRDAAHQTNSHQINLWPQADQSLIQIVTETVYFGKRQHLTEKSFKPIVMQQPFILVSCQGSLDYLRSYGFRTFSEFWDESYDDADDSTRISKIGKILTDLNSMSSNERRNLQKHIASTVDYNFNWFHSREFEQLLWKELTSMIDCW